MLKVLFRCSIIVLFLFSYSSSFAAINYTLTPIKYELELQPGESITLPASIKNNGDKVVTLPTTASDFQSNGLGGTPSFVRKSELVYPDQQLSTWITIQDDFLTLNPGEEKTTNFNITVPTNATPGGHYGAIFFKNDNSETSTGNIGINVDYGIIILVNVAGEIIVDVEIEDPIISGGGKAPTYDICDGNDTSGSIYDGDCGESKIIENTGEEVGDTTPSINIPWYVGEDSKGNPIYEFPDNCPWGDFTTSKYDKKCIELKYPSGGPTGNNQDNTLVNPETGDTGGAFEVNFTFPINNKGNTHIKPGGQIVLRDENGNIIKAIGKETITNDRGAVIGEKIVDYIPINDEGGNILPGTKRIFESQWKGFPYKEYDENGNPVVYYQNPSDYYTQKNKQDAGFLMLWERVSEVRTHKKITAEIEMIYYDENGNPIDFTTSKDFSVQYIEQKVTVNPYVVLGLLLIATISLMTWFAIRWWILVGKKNKCWNCEESIKSHWKTCPHCEAIQNKKKHKSFTKQHDEALNTKIVKKRKTIKKDTTTVKGENPEMKKTRGRPKKTL